MTAWGSASKPLYFGIVRPLHLKADLGRAGQALSADARPAGARLLHYRGSKPQRMVRMARPRERRTAQVMHHDHNRAEQVCRRGAQSHAGAATENDFEPWLAGGAGIGLLTPAAEDMLQRGPVSKRVNSSKAPACDPTLIDRIRAGISCGEIAEK
jgi:hypothetical protein